MTVSPMKPAGANPRWRETITLPFADCARRRAFLKEDRHADLCLFRAGNSVDERQKDAIAEAIARVHSEETNAPKLFCQIVIDEKKPTSRFLGPSRSSGRIRLRGDIRAGSR